jgi:hypothetical protein
MLVNEGKPDERLTEAEVSIYTYIYQKNPKKNSISSLKQTNNFFQQIYHSHSHNKILTQHFV